MTTGNLYTFGCSMTSYSHPTWADIIGRSYSYFENWARPGAGNQYIFNSIIECLQRNTLTENDTIVVMWTTVSRIDYYQFNEWSHLVNAHVTDTQLKNYPISCPDGYEILSYAYFAAIEKLLSMSGINYKMITWTDYDKNCKSGKIYKSILDKITEVKFEYNKLEYGKNPTLELKNYYDRLSGTDWPKFEDIFSYTQELFSIDVNLEVLSFLDSIEKNRHLYFRYNDVDPHPRPLQHLKMVEKYFDDIDISQDTKDWINDIEYKLINDIKYQFNKSLPEKRL